MEEINPFVIDDDTEPSFESDVAKWFLIKKGKHYAGWRWDSKKDKTLKKYLITDIDTNDVVSDGHLLEDMLVKITFYDIAKEDDG